jgi:hypothetical protein
VVCSGLLCAVFVMRFGMGLRTGPTVRSGWWPTGRRVMRCRQVVCDVCDLCEFFLFWRCRCGYRVDVTVYGSVCPACGREES